MSGGAEAISKLRDALLLVSTQRNSSRRDTCIWILAISAIVLVALALTWTATRRPLTEINSQLAQKRRAHFALGDFAAPPIGITLVREEPCIRLVEGFVTRAEAQHLVTKYYPRLARSTVVIDQNNAHELSKARTSSTAILPTGEEDDVVAAIEERVVLLTGTSTRFWENFQLTHYTQGQHYKPHTDWFDTEENNRTITIFVYLNDLDCSQGGTTYFPKLDLRVQPKLGRALIWHNCNARGSSVVCDPDTEHAGTPPLSGEKFGLNCWARTLPLRSWTKRVSEKSKTTSTALQLRSQQLANRSDG